jgi:hypothetical protein
MYFDLMRSAPYLLRAIYPHKRCTRPQSAPGTRRLGQRCLVKRGAAQTGPRAAPAPTDPQRSTPEGPALAMLAQAAQLHTRQEAAS